MKHSHYINKIFICFAAGTFIAGVLLNTSSSLNNTIILTDSTISQTQDGLNLITGKKLYKSNCGKCHTLYKPKDYRLEQWKENLDDMKIKAVLTNEEYELILLYLKKNCKK